jgi:cyclase
MLKQRLSAVIAVRNSWVVQSIGFRRFLPVGDAGIVAENFNRWGADEILLLDISPDRHARGPDMELIRAVASRTLTPLAYGGGIRSVEDVRRAIREGGDKVVINTAACENLAIIEEGAATFGAQCMVVALDVGRDADGRPVLYADSGRRSLEGRAPAEFARQAEQAGAGEILVNAIHRDGTRSGYDVALLAEIAAAVRSPVIACGGAGTPSDMAEALRVPGVGSAAVGNILHYTEHAIAVAKAALADGGSLMRYDTYADYRGRRFDSQGRIDRLTDSQLQELYFVNHPEERI